MTHTDRKNEIERDCKKNISKISMYIGVTDGKMFYLRNKLATKRGMLDEWMISDNQR